MARIHEGDGSCAFRISGGGDRGAGDREKRGREVYGRREMRGREAGFPRWREAGEKGKNYATLCNISQSKKCKGAGAKKYRAGTGIEGYGKREVQSPLSPPPRIIGSCHGSINTFHHLQRVSPFQTSEAISRILQPYRYVLLTNRFPFYDSY